MEDGIGMITSAEERERESETVDSIRSSIRCAQGLFDSFNYSLFSKFWESPITTAKICRSNIYLLSEYGQLDRF